MRITAVRRDGSDSKWHVSIEAPYDDSNVAIASSKGRFLWLTYLRALADLSKVLALKSSEIHYFCHVCGKDIDRINDELKPTCCSCCEPHSFRYDAAEDCILCEKCFLVAKDFKQDDSNAI